MDLIALGWNEFFAAHFGGHAADGLTPARVVLEHKHAYTLLGEAGEFTGELRGRLLKSGARSGLPAVGDWVALERPDGAERALIHAVLPRRTQFSRRAAGERSEEQIVAANIDTVFLVNGLDADFNPRRIERYLALTRASGAAPVVLLNKADLCAESEQRAEEIRRLGPGVPVLLLSAQTGWGFEALGAFLAPGATVALLGSSGAGKSTIANRLLGCARQAVATVREHDQRGRHTTTRRELMILPGGTLLIDTPGMRELQLWDTAQEGLPGVFPEIMELAAACRFRDCRHEAEPGCAVRLAIERGELRPERFASFVKLRGELEALALSSARGNRPGRGSGPRITGRRIMRG